MQPDPTPVASTSQLSANITNGYQDGNTESLRKDMLPRFSINPQMSAQHSLTVPPAAGSSFDLEGPTTPKADSFLQKQAFNQQLSRQMQEDYLDYLSSYSNAYNYSAAAYGQYPDYTQSGYSYPSLDNMSSYSYDPSYGYYSSYDTSSYPYDMSTMSGGDMSAYLSSYDLSAASLFGPEYMAEARDTVPRIPKPAPAKSSVKPSAVPGGQVSDSDLSSASNKSGKSNRSTGSAKEKRFFCETCGEGFARNYNLKSHVSAKHEHEKPFTCTICGKSFSRKHDTARHLTARHGFSLEDSQAEVTSRYPAGSGAMSS